MTPDFSVCFISVIVISVVVFCNNVVFSFITCTALWLDQKSLLNVLYK